MTKINCGNNFFSFFISQNLRIALYKLQHLKDIQKLMIKHFLIYFRIFIEVTFFITDTKSIKTLKSKKAKIEL